MPRYAKRKDVNHNEIEDTFRQMLADHVTDSSGWGGGAGDLFVSYGTFGCFIEIKRDEHAKLKPLQIQFRNRHPQQWYRCESIEAAIDISKEIRRMGRVA